MPIIKPFMESVKFFTTIGAGTGTGPTFNILSTAFTDDIGETATSFPSSYAYYNLYINGVLQTGNTSSITATGINIPNGDELNDRVPILVEFVVN